MDTASLVQRFIRIRSQSLRLCAPLEVEDMVVQSMDDTSPTRWHLGHTTWFFETFVLREANRPPFDSRFRELFNSYYNAVGPQPERSRRGRLSRPTVRMVRAYREHVDESVVDLLENGATDEQRRIVSLGLQHEQQHQELMLTDIKHALCSQPWPVVYQPRDLPAGRLTSEHRWYDFAGGLVEVGSRPCGGDQGFSWDNEHPRHRVYLEPWSIAHEPVSCGQWMQFIEDGGYEEPALWLSDGWAWLTQNGIRAPLYWHDSGGAWREATLHGERAIDPSCPVTHVSFYEADAFASWAGARLPTEFEWEHACATHAGPDGRYVEAEMFHPLGARGDAPVAMMGGCWEWTSSAYRPYPGYVQPAGALGEYNGKFMSGQMVLRGGSVATPESHARAEYRNFFAPDKRWQFTGVRLAR